MRFEVVQLHAIYAHISIYLSDEILKTGYQTQIHKYV